MPKLTRVRLVDPTHSLPMPGHARLFSTQGETVDLHDTFWRHRLADGSIAEHKEPEGERKADGETSLEGQTAPGGQTATEGAPMLALPAPLPPAADEPGAPTLDSIRHLAG